MESDSLETIVLSGNVPAFILKLWKLVEDSQFDKFISWSKGGTTFLVHSSTRFAKEILPMFFKHSNFASFVRQLNMYGFRKVIVTEQGGLKPDKDDWEFYHPNFLQGRSELLELVKRKGQPENDKKAKSLEASKVFEDIKILKDQHDMAAARMNVLKSENELLWHELRELRSKHERQQQVINRLVQYFISLVCGKGSGLNAKRRHGLAIESPGSLVPKKRKTNQPFASSPNLSNYKSLEYVVESPTSGEGPSWDDNVNNSQIVLLDDNVVTLDEGNSASAITPVDDSPFIQEVTTPSPKPAIDTGSKQGNVIKKAKLEVKLPRRKGLPEKLTTLLTPTLDSDTFNSCNDLPTMVSQGPGIRSSTVTPVTSAQDRLIVDPQLESIASGIDFLQNRLQGENLYIDPEALSDLFFSADSNSEPIVPQSLLGNLQQQYLTPTETDDRDGDGKIVEPAHEGSRHELVQYSKPFSPDQFLNDIFGSDKDVTVAEDPLPEDI